MADRHTPEQDREIDDVSAAGVPFMSGSQGRGAVRGALIGGIAGALVLGLVGALVPLAGLDVWPRVLLFALVGALAFGVAGLVFGGGREPELEGDLQDLRPDRAAGIHAHDPAAAARIVERESRRA